MLAIADSGANIHLLKQDDTTMPPVITSNEMTVGLPDEKNGVLTHHNTPDTRYKQENEEYPHFTKNEDSPTNMIRSLM